MQWVLSECHLHVLVERLIIQYGYLPMTQERFTRIRCPNFEIRVSWGCTLKNGTECFFLNLPNCFVWRSKPWNPTAMITISSGGQGNHRGLYCKGERFSESTDHFSAFFCNVLLIAGNHCIYMVRPPIIIRLNVLWKEITKIKNTHISILLCLASASAYITADARITGTWFQLRGIYTEESHDHSFVSILEIWPGWSKEYKVRRGLIWCLTRGRVT
jgi:hypothetical protein